MSSLILIVDDEEDIRTSLGGILEDEGYQVLSAANGSEALDIAREELPDLVLLDIWMPGLDGIQTLEQIKLLSPEMTVVMMSGHGTIETAVRATRLGAFDFIEKPFSLDKLLITVGNAIRLKELHKENLALRMAVQKEHELVGMSPAMESLRLAIQRIAPVSTPVLINGESGVGKELAARAIHHASPRKDKPFVTVNCMAIPEELLHLELFGQELDGREGGILQKRGRFDLADGGTVFLDEVQELPITVQTELLRVLTDNCFERQNGQRPVRCDLRVVAATSRSLDVALRGGKFLEDLYHCLHVVPLHMCPLRERAIDIPQLVSYFVQQFHQKEGWNPLSFHASVLESMQQYDWPGNVRELKNMVERILIMATGPVVTMSDLPDSFVSSLPVKTDGSMEACSSKEQPSLQMARQRFEQEFIARRLDELQWDMDKVSSSLGLERVLLHRKLVQYNLSPEAGRKE